MASHFLSVVHGHLHLLNFRICLGEMEASGSVYMYERGNLAVYVFKGKALRLTLWWLCTVLFSARSFWDTLVLPRKGKVGAQSYVLMMESFSEWDVN